MRNLAAAAFAPVFFGFLLWALRTYSLTRGPAGAVGALILLVPAGICAGLMAAVYWGRVDPWSWPTKLLAAFYAGVLILTLFYLPSMQRALRLREETRTTSELSSLRQSISAWDKDRGAPPDRLSHLVPHYLNILPRLSLPGTGHPVTREVEFVQSRAGVDTGKWLYVNNPKNPFYGKVRINCTHRDSRGFRWSGY